MMRAALLLVLAACSPAADVQWVEEGAYELQWSPEVPESFVGCSDYILIEDVESAPTVMFRGEPCAVRFSVFWRDDCVCTPRWCLCPSVGALYAEIDGAELWARKLD